MLWRTYALLSHGGDRIGLRSWRMPFPLRRPANDVLTVLENADTAIWSAAALSACAESGLLRHLARPVSPDEVAQDLALPPALVRTLLDVLADLGFVSWNAGRVLASPSLMPFTTPEGSETFRACLRASLLQTESFRQRLRDGALSLDGWTHTDEDVIEAQGKLTQLWTNRALPKLKYLPGLVARLEQPGAAVLDVGAGAAGLSIALCRHFPHLHALALEPAPHPAAIGERLVEASGLADRIAVRRQRAEHLEDDRAFDLAFLPQMFLPDPILPEALERIFRALRPGGWMLVPVLAQDGHGMLSAVNRLKNLIWGGSCRNAAQLKLRLTAAGYDPVIRAPGGRSLRMICARRPILRDPS